MRRLLGGVFIFFFVTSSYLVVRMFLHISGLYVQSEMSGNLWWANIVYVGFSTFLIVPIISAWDDL